MKFVVPLRIPVISLISLAARHCDRGRMTGIPPPRLASKDNSRRAPALF